MTYSSLRGATFSPIDSHELSPLGPIGSGYQDCCILVRTVKWLTGALATEGGVQHVDGGRERLSMCVCLTCM